MVRDVDVTGISGTGVIIWGILWPDGTVAYRWNTQRSTTCIADSLDDVVAIHGHEGATRLVWVDPCADSLAWMVEAHRGGTAA